MKIFIFPVPFIDKSLLSFWFLGEIFIYWIHRLFCHIFPFICLLIWFIHFAKYRSFKMFLKISPPFLSHFHSLDFINLFLMQIQHFLSFYLIHLWLGVGSSSQRLLIVSNPNTQPGTHRMTLTVPDVCCSQTCYFFQQGFLSARVLWVL